VIDAPIAHTAKFGQATTKKQAVRFIQVIRDFILTDLPLQNV
jgi:hypothetical protein